MFGAFARSKRPVILSVIAITSLSLSGCSVWNPYRDGNNEAYKNSVSLASAVAYAESTRERYYDNVREQTFINKTTGVALIGAAAAAAFFGIQGGHSNIVTGLGVGGAGLFGVNSLLYSYPRLGVYVAGAKAITCAISLYAPFGTFFRDKSAISVEDLKKQSLIVRRLTVEVQMPGNDNLLFVKDILKRTESTLQNVVKIDTQLNTAGVQLYETVQIIHANVSQQLLVNEPNLEEVIKDLGKDLQTNAGFITNTKGIETTPDTPFTPDPGTARAAGAESFGLQSENDAKAAQKEKKIAATKENLVLEAQRLQNMRNDIEQRIEEFKELPEDTSLQACAEFESIKPLLVLPQPSLNVNLRDGGGGIVRISGGRRPYSVGWVGPSPIGTVKLTEKKFTSEQEKFSAGRLGLQIEVSGEGKVPDQNLQLVIEDSGQEMKTVMVNITGTDGKPADPPTPAPTPAAANQSKFDATVAALQDRLIALGCMAKTRQVGNRTLQNLDGLKGSVTSAAISSLRRAIQQSGSTTGVDALTPAADGSINYGNALTAAKATSVKC